MLKIAISIQDKDGNGHCNVKIEAPKNLEKAKDSEKTVMSTVYNTITKALEDLQNQSKNL